jgi:hypothetical protein
MSTEIDNNETSVTYEFTNDTSTRVVTIPKTGDQALDQQVVNEEHAAWLAWLGVAP